MKINLDVDQLREVQFLIPEGMIVENVEHNIKGKIQGKIDLGIVPLSPNYSRRFNPDEAVYYSHYATMRRSGDNKQQLFEAYTYINSLEGIKIVSIKII